MNIAKLTISYDRGLAHNDERDVKQDAKAAIFGRGATTPDGKIIRGLGTHYESQEAMLSVQDRDREARRIYTEFRARFLATPLEGVYVVNKMGDAKRFIEGLSYRDDMRVYVTEFELTAPGELNADEVRMWATKVQRQLSGISLGRSKEADEDGLKALKYLSTCPVLKKETGTRIRELVSMVRDGRMDRVEIKRNLEKLDVQVETATLAPRRAPRVEINS